MTEATSVVLVCQVPLDLLVTLVSWDPLDRRETQAVWDLKETTDCLASRETLDQWVYLALWDCRDLRGSKARLELWDLWDFLDLQDRREREETLVRWEPEERRVRRETLVSQGCLVREEGREREARTLPVPLALMAFLCLAVGGGRTNTRNTRVTTSEESPPSQLLPRLTGSQPAQ